jgi:hypothetical protein
MVSGIEQLAASIFKALRQMDGEADTKRGDAPTGLSWYGGHAKPEQKRPQTEPLWSKRLAQLLQDAGYDAQAEVTYPVPVEQGRTRCDLVIRTDSGQCIWLEIKGAWRSYWAQHGALHRYRTYLLYPLVESSLPKGHSLPQDIQKLDRLTREDASDIAILLIGFEQTDEPMDDDIAELRELSGLGSNAWPEWSDQWDDPHRPGERVRCWLWSAHVTKST